MTDDVVVILPRREAQGLYDLLDVGLAPKPGKPSALLDSKGKPKPAILVALKSVFPAIYSALEDALKTEPTPLDDAETFRRLDEALKPPEPPEAA